VTSGGMYAQNEVEWAPWLRTTFGIRGDVSQYRVDALDPVNSGTASAGIVSPKAGATFGPWKSTEFYINAGTGFHSNNALGTTITRDSEENPIQRVTPLVRAKGAEVGVCTVVVPHLQSTVSVWTLGLGSELVYNGDIGATEPGPASERHGVEIANYYSPYTWLVFDADLSLSKARFTGDNPAGTYVPEAVRTVVSAGASVDGFHRAFGSVRMRYFGSRGSRRTTPCGRSLRRSSTLEPATSSRRTCASRLTSSTCSTPGTATSTTTSHRACRASLWRVSTISISIPPCRAPCGSVWLSASNGAAVLNPGGAEVLRRVRKHSRSGCEEFPKEQVPLPGRCQKR
jgi:hypothetical protein